MSSAIRSAVTSIMKNASNMTTPTVVNRESVPMREEIYASTPLTSPREIGAAMHKLSRHIAETTASARSLPVLGGTYHPGVVFVANTPQTFAHGIQGGVDVSFLIASPRKPTANVAITVFETAQDAPTGRVTLTAFPAGITCDVWIFPRPTVA